MELFHRKTKKIRTLIEQGKLREAKRVLFEHLEAEHGFNSDFAGLQRAIINYSKGLNRLRDLFNSLKGPEQVTPLLQLELESIEKNLRDIQALIRKLQVDVKLKLV